MVTTPMINDKMTDKLAVMASSVNAAIKPLNIIKNDCYSTIQSNWIGYKIKSIKLDMIHY